MRFYHTLAFVALFAVSAPAFAQPAAPPLPPEQDVEEDEAQPQQYQYQQQQGDNMPPPDPNAYAQQQEQYGFMGPHPIPYDAGSGYCYQGGAHFHEYPPFDQNLFREQGGWFYFVGDAGDFGYAQQMWGYRGHHPIPGGYGGGYCFMDWPHRHHYAPAVGVAFNFVGGYYNYAGPFDPWYWRWRSHYTAYYGGYYRQSYYGGNYYRLRPAPIYRPHVVVGAPGVYRAGAVVMAPGGARVRVVAPRPYAPGPGGRVVVGAPGVRVGAPRPYAPGPPRPYAPAPQVVGPPRAYAPAPRVVGPPAGRPMSAPARSVPAPHPSAPAHVGGGGGGGHHR